MAAGALIRLRDARDETRRIDWVFPRAGGAKSRLKASRKRLIAVAFLPTHDSTVKWLLDM